MFFSLFIFLKLYVCFCKSGSMYSNLKKTYAAQCINSYAYFPDFSACFVLKTYGFLHLSRTLISFFHEYYLTLNSITLSFFHSTIDSGVIMFCNKLEEILDRSVYWLLFLYTNYVTDTISKR